MKILESIKLLIDGKDLTFDLSKSTMDEIMEGKVTPSQFGSFVTALKLKRETPEEIAGMATAMRNKSLSVSNSYRLLDTCGTGGDNKGTFNISTASAIVASSSGAKVAKHGNRAMSGSTGSADVLENLGVKISLSPNSVKHCIDQIGIGFIFAQSFHPAMKFAAPLRKELGIPTVFNVLGPLTNPANAETQLIGVSNPDLAPKVAEALKILKIKKALVVHGSEGMDEISVEGDTIIWEVNGDIVKRRKTRPADFSLPEGKNSSLLVGSTEESANIIKSILNGAGSELNDSSDISSCRKAVIINSAAALVAYGLTDNFQEAANLASESIDSGASLDKLNQLIKITNELE